MQPHRMLSKHEPTSIECYRNTNRAYNVIKKTRTDLRMLSENVIETKTCEPAQMCVVKDNPCQPVHFS